MKTQAIIVGGGLAGLTLACALGSAGVKVVCLDKEPPNLHLLEKYDGRTTAVSFAAHKTVTRAGVWAAMKPDAEPILDIRVADGASPLFLHFDSSEDGVGQPFGWIIENRLMRKALFARIAALKTVTHLAPAEITKFFRERSSVGVVLKDGTKIEAPLLLGADGRNSAVRTWCGIKTYNIDYKQSAIVCNAAHEYDHENVAVEHFRAAGPFAALPMTRGEDGEYRSSIVWTEHGGDAKKIAALPPEEFDEKLQELFGDTLGKVRHISKPMIYPLTLLHAETYTAPRVALLAEAAHAIHPIAGQGLNLSMRDIDALCDLIVERLKLGLDIGAADLLSAYESRRRFDTHRMAAATDLLNRLFSNNMKSVALLRDLGLGMVQKMPFLKRYFAAQAMGISEK